MQDLQDRVLQFIESPAGETEFDSLARAVFAYQYETVPLYRRFCEMRRSSPTTVRSWQEIAALPADAFKETLTKVPRPYVFVSSGTTAGPRRRSRHALSSLATYRLSAMTHFRRMVVPDGPGPMAVLLLGPSPATHPHSSLATMFGWCIEDLSNGEVLRVFTADGQADIDAAVAWLERRAAEAAPVLLLGVTSAFTALFAALRKRRMTLRLPADSRVVDTGGNKGAGAPVLSSRGLLKAAWRFLHVPAYLSVNEYGMTEMLSQFYDDALATRYQGALTPRAKVGPAWVRTAVVDPSTLAPVADGEVGILRHLDLANWESVSALQTLDIGRRLGRGFELLGRVAGAEARGCSQLLAVVHDCREAADAER